MKVLAFYDSDEISVVIAYHNQHIVPRYISHLTHFTISAVLENYASSMKGSSGARRDNGTHDLRQYRAALSVRVRLERP